MILFVVRFRSVRFGFYGAGRPMSLRFIFLSRRMFAIFRKSITELPV
jgi:hypothetical protein